MATPTVTGLENELKLLLEDVERMQADHADSEFPPEVAALWDHTNRKIEETKKQLELARRRERMEELQRSTPVNHENEGTLAHFQVGNSQWREDPYNVTQASRIYFLPNLMTAGNLFCGFMAIVNCIQARLAESAVTILPL